MTETEVIQLVLDAHNRAVASYVITRYPDRENRSSRDIDAYAESAGLRPLAIEHTEVVSVPEQNRNSAWFVRALGALEQELAGAFPFQLSIVVPYKNVSPGSDWSRVRRLVGDWLLANCPTLPEGRSTITVPGVSFGLTLWKRRSSDDNRVFLVREVPPGDAEADLRREMHKGLDHKHEQLAEYRAAGSVTALVLESEDIALVSPQSLYTAYLRATRERPRPYLDQVWMVATGNVYCFDGPAALLEGVNPPNFRFGPQFIDEWLPAADDR